MSHAAGTFRSQRNHCGNRRRNHRHLQPRRLICEILEDRRVLSAAVPAIEVFGNSPAVSCVSGGYNTTHRGDYNAFVVKIGNAPVSQRPVVQELIANPDPVSRSGVLTLTASGAAIRMQKSSGSHSIATATVTLGEHTFFARARDNRGDWSDTDQSKI